MARAVRRLSPGILFAAMGLLGFGHAADAHPHVWIDATVMPIFDEGGRFSAVHEKWTFDMEYTEGIGPELDVNKDGFLEPEEIQNAPKNALFWMTYTYFTRITVAGREVARKPPDDLAVTIWYGRLVAEFTLALAEPQAVTFGAGVDVFDPEFYYDVEFANPDIDGSHLPANCTAGRRNQPNLDPTAVMLIRKLGLSADPLIVTDPAAGYSTRVAIDCR